MQRQDKITNNIEKYIHKPVLVALDNQTCYNAIGRQLGMLLTPEPNIVHIYQQLGDLLLNDISGIYKQHEFIDIDEYISELPSKKKGQYQRFYRMMQQDQHKSYQFFYKRARQYKAFVKKLELVYLDRCPFKNKKYASQKVRGRNIMNPQYFVKLIGGVMAKNVLSYLKDLTHRGANYAVISGYNDIQQVSIARHFYRRVLNPVIISMDGSEHDKSQTEHWLNLDKRLWQTLEQYFLSNFPMQYINIVKGVLKNFQQHKSNITVMSNHNDRLCCFELFGTVLSGNPVLTTLGNSMRMIVLDMLLSLDIPKQNGDYWNVAYLVSGDDNVIIVNEQYINQLLTNIRTFTSVENLKMKQGIGYIIKEMHISRHHMLFLSKIWYLTKDHCSMSRLTAKAISGGYSTTSINVTDEEHSLFVISALMRSFNMNNEIGDNIQYRINQHEIRYGKQVIIEDLYTHVDLIMERLRKQNDNEYDKYKWQLGGKYLFQKPFPQYSMIETIDSINFGPYQFIFKEISMDKNNIKNRIQYQSSSKEDIIKIYGQYQQINTNIDYRTYLSLCSQSVACENGERHSIISIIQINYWRIQNSYKQHKENMSYEPKYESNALLERLNELETKVANSAETQAPKQGKNAHWKWKVKQGNQNLTYDPTLKEVRNVLNQNNKLRQELTDLAKVIKRMDSKNKLQMSNQIKQMVGNTVLQKNFANKSMKEKIANDKIDSMTAPQVEKLLEVAIDGPFLNSVVSMVTPWLKHGTRQAVHAFKTRGIPKLQQLYNQFKETDQGHKILETVNDWTNLDLHDYSHPMYQANDFPLQIQQGFSQSVENVKTTNTTYSQMSSQGVSIQAIQASLNPEAYKSLVPTCETPMGFISRMLTYPVVTNSSGECLISIHAANVVGDSFLTNMNAADYNPSDGTGTPSYSPGPYVGHDDVLQTYQMVGFQVRLLITTAPINTTGSVIMAMNPEGFTLGRYDGADKSVGTNDLLSAPFCVNSSISQANGLQIAIEPLQQDDIWIKGSAGNIFGTTGANAVDQVIFQFQGAQASSEIGKIVIVPLIQYIPSPSKSQFHTLSMPPVGILTIPLLKNIISFNKNILLLGRAEMNELTAGIGGCQPTYDSVINYIINFLGKPHLSASLSSNIGTGTFSKGQSSGGHLYQEDEEETIIEQQHHKTQKQLNKETHAKNGNIQEYSDTESDATCQMNQSQKLNLE